MIKYNIEEKSVRIPYREQEKIVPGCTQTDEDSRIVCGFYSKEEAEEEIKKKKYRPSCTLQSYANGSFLVEEYAIAAYEVDEDGEFVGHTIDYDFPYEYIFDEESKQIVIK